MKKLLFILLTGLMLASCKDPTPISKLSVVLEHPKSVTVHFYGFNNSDYADSFFIFTASDGHDYYTFNWGKDLLHYPDCKLCLSRANLSAPLNTGQVIHDTIYIQKKDTPVQKRVRLLCINDGDLIQQGRLHDGQTHASNAVIVGTIYTTIAPVYVDNGDSVYYIDGIGQKLIHRFIKPY